MLKNVTYILNSFIVDIIIYNCSTIMTDQYTYVSLITTTKNYILVPEIREKCATIFNV